MFDMSPSQHSDQCQHEPGAVPAAAGGAPPGPGRHPGVRQPGQRRQGEDCP